MKRAIVILMCPLFIGCGYITKKSSDSNNNNFIAEGEPLVYNTVDIAYDTSVSAEIEKVWTTREIKEYGNVIYGVTNVHCNFTINNYKGRTGSVVVYIEPQYCEKESDGYYTYDSFTTKYESSEFGDYQVTIKDQDIRYSFGDYSGRNYKIRVAISDDENTKLAESNYIGITLPEVY